MKEENTIRKMFLMLVIQSSPMHNGISSGKSKFMSLPQKILVIINLENMCVVLLFFRL